MAQGVSPGMVPDSVQVPSYVRFVSDSVMMCDVWLDDSTFYEVSRGVVFPVNKYVLDRQDPLVQELGSLVLPMAREREWTLAGIELRGAASPEGPTPWNVTLSRRRAQSIIDFLTTELGQSTANLITAHTTPEDYAYLLRSMEAAHDVDAPRVRQLMERHGGDTAALKAALQKADGGRLWRRMLATYYPKLRAARLVLFFRTKSLPVAMVEPLPVERVSCELMPRPTLVSADTKWMERRHVLSVATNLLYYGMYMPGYGWAPMPNVEIEYYPREYGLWTWLASFTCPYWHKWDSHEFFQIRDYHLEVRRYWRPGLLHTGAFASLYANADKYGIGLSATRGWQGEGLGAALKLGYVWRLGASGRWRIEASAAMGGYVTRFDPYVYGNPVTGMYDGDYYYDYTGRPGDFDRRNHQRIWIGPTELGVKLRYDLLYKRVAKRGVSLRRKEVAR